MEPIINPWFIYLLSIIENINTVLVIFCTILFFFLFGVGIVKAACLIEGDEGDNEEFNSKLREYKFIWVVILTFVILFINILLPSKNTIIGMYVASNITTKTLQDAKNMSKDIHDTIKGDILDIITELTKETDKHK